MIDFVVVTRYPARQGMIGPIHARDVVTERAYPSLEAAVESVDVPAGGSVLIVQRASVVKVVAKCRNEVAE